MSNLSSLKRQEMLNYIEQLKKIHKDDDSIVALNNIANALTEKKYGLVWEEYSEGVDEVLEEYIPVFSENEERKIHVNDDDNYNFLLEGDNLYTLKLLEKTHKNKIDVIYIDPPYNTKNKDFVYNDTRIGVDDGFRHSKWISFMEKRLSIAKQLLSDQGLIFISIDDNEMANLKLLCDEIFGEKNFVNCIAVKMSEATGVKMTHVEKRLPKLKEYVLFYKVNSNSDLTLNEIKIPKEQWDNEYKILVENVTKEELDIVKHAMKTENLSGNEIEKVDVICRKMRFTNVNTMMTNLKKASDKLEFLHKNSFRILRDVATSGGAKRIADKKRIENNISEGAFLINTSRNKTYLMRGDYNMEAKQPRAKLLFADQYLDVHVGDFWSDIKTTGLGDEGNIDFLNGKKPLKMIMRLLSLPKTKDMIVLDFFAGSGTTGHAVTQLNKNDGGNRKYILCTNNENNICEEVTYQRLNNIQSELPHNLKYFKTDFIKKFNNEEELLSDHLLSHIKEMVELENMCRIDGENKVLILSSDELDNWFKNNIKEKATVYLPSYILLSREIEVEAKKKEIQFIDVPDYYFLDELREVNEL